MIDVDDGGRWNIVEKNFLGIYLGIYFTMKFYYFIVETFLPQRQNHKALPLQGTRSRINGIDP